MGGKLGDVDTRAASAGNSGDSDVCAVAGIKLGEMATDRRLGDLGTDGTRLDNTGDDGVKFGDAGVIATAGISGDTDFFGMQGRKFGDVANESVRLGGELGVVNGLGHVAPTSLLPRP